MARAAATPGADQQALTDLLEELQRREAEATVEQRQHARYLAAYLRIYQGDFRGGADIFAQLFEEVKAPNLRFRAGTMLALTYGGMQEFEKAFRVLNEAMGLVDSVSDPEVVHKGLMNAAQMTNMAGQYATSLEYAQRVIDESQDPLQHCNAMAMGTEANLRLGEIRSEAPFVEGVEFCSAQQALLPTYLLRLYHTRWLTEVGRAEDAMQLLATHYDAMQAFGYPWIISESNALMAEMQLAAGEREEARRHALIAIDALPTEPTALPVISAYRTLYLLSKQSGLIPAALGYHEKLTELQQTRLSDLQARELAFQRIRFESDEQQRRIEMLHKQNDVLRLQQEVERQSARAGYLLAAFLATLLASLCFWAWRVKRNQTYFRRLAETDMLTGACSRQRFTEVVERHLATLGRNGPPSSQVIFDLDHFKTINDRFGHPVGDWALMRVVAACRSVLPPDHVIGRLGGEEFAILMPATDRNAAAERADACRQAIAAIDTAPSGRSFTLTASFGVADTGSAGPSFRDLFAQADRQLYVSKRLGRNRVSVELPPMPPPSGSGPDLDTRWASGVNA